LQWNFHFLIVLSGLNCQAVVMEIICVGEAGIDMRLRDGNVDSAQQLVSRLSEKSSASNEPRRISDK